MIHHGDCLDVMATLPECSVDAVVTDPPYGLSFMGKAWDHAVPGAPFWEAALRVAKPGAHLLAFGGTRTYHRLTCAIEDAGWEIRDCVMWLYGTGFPKSHNGAHGGTALKPGWEPVIVARKKLAGTVAENFAKWGTGGIDVDAGRTETRPEVPGSSNIKAENARAMGNGWDRTAARRAEAYRANPPTGRWPANVILDEEAGAMLDEQSGVSHAKPQRVGRKGGCGSPRSLGNSADYIGTWPADPGGGASRFFYCAKASRRERGDGNDHPTVKPLSLMRYLVKLFVPVGGVVLDPFAGSGSTGIAALQEGRSFVGIERDAHNVEIARRRIAEADPVLRTA